MAPLLPDYPVVANYLLTICAVSTFFLALGALTIRIRRPRTPRPSPTLLVADLLVLLCGMTLCTAVVLLMLSDDEPTTRSLLCRIGGQALPAALQTYTWIAAMRAFLKLRHLSCPPPSQQVYRLTGGDRCSRLLTISAIVTIAATAAVLGVLPTLLPETGAVNQGSPTGLKCLPVFSWRSNLHYYSIILFFFGGLGLLYFAILLCILLCASYRRRRRQRQGRARPEGKQASPAQSVADFASLCVTNVVFMALAGVSDRNRDDLLTRVLRWLFLWLAVATPLVHAIMTLLVHWKRFKRRKRRKETVSWSALPKSFMHVQRLQEGQTKWIFRVDWFSGPAVLQKGDLKIFAPVEKRQWCNEANAARKLTRYPHPGLCRYLWISRTNPYRAVFACLMKDGTLMKGCRLICRLNHDGGELVRFLGANPITFGDMHGAALDMSSALRHLKRLRLLHNALSTATVRVMLTNQGQSFKPVITDFEESVEVPMESLIQNPTTRQLLIQDRYHSYVQRPESNEDSIFSTDSRAFGLLLLDMLLCVIRRGTRNSSCLEEEDEEEEEEEDTETDQAMEAIDESKKGSESPEGLQTFSSSVAPTPDRQQLIHPLLFSSSASTASEKENCASVQIDGSVCSQSDTVSHHTLSTALTSRPPEFDACSTLPSRRLGLYFTPTLHHRRYCDSIQRRFPHWLAPGCLLEADGTRVHRIIRDRLRRLLSVNVKEAEEISMLAVSAWSSTPCVSIEEIDQSLARIRGPEHNGLPSG